MLGRENLPALNARSWLDRVVPVLKFINNIEDYTCRFLLGLFVILIFAQVVMRATLGIGMAWIEELSRYAFVWFVFLGAAHAAHLGAHNRLQVHINLLPKRVANGLLLFVDLIWVGFCLTLAWKSLSLIELLFAFPYRTPAMGWSLVYVYMIFPVAFVLMAFRVLQVQYLKLVKGVELGDIDQEQVDKIIEDEAAKSPSSEK
ncbi:TRAP transporter small permease [Halomonas sp. DQ26W]|uniref:TRAP transporter small permease n=1 Tax=Halomonas sp. DQ26W TaxID=2282311 RepID=UPI000DF8464D|nr:TRAP transporter small permease [Halomonas sp. DQ26W]RDB43448.1 TRAP transporter small permease [Halomonas sp. DQ26W]